VSRRAQAPPPTPMALVLDALRDLVREVVADELRRQSAAATTTTPGLVTVQEYARRRSISPSTVRKAIRTGRLPATKIGRSVRIAADAQIGAPVQPSAGRSDRAARRALGLEARH